MLINKLEKYGMEIVALQEIRWIYAVDKYYNILWVMRWIKTKGCSFAVNKDLLPAVKDFKVIHPIIILFTVAVR